MRRLHHANPEPVQTTSSGNEFFTPQIKYKIPTELNLHNARWFGSNKSANNISHIEVNNLGSSSLVATFEIEGPDSPQVEPYSGYATGGRVDLKEGGKSDKNWIQKVNKSIKKRGTKGKCTPITKKGCTGRAKGLAKTFKKMAKKRKKS